MAAVPLLWVLPLALYLLTFVIVFARRPIIPHWLVVAVQPVFVIALVAVLVFDLKTEVDWIDALVFDPLKTIVGLIALHVAVFFVSALMCHGELARTRPAARYLTAFYLWMSAGGVIGGIAAGLIAPHVFNWVAEYPILIALAVLCRPGPLLPDDDRLRYLLLLGARRGGDSPDRLHAASPVTVDESYFNWIFGTLIAVSVLFWRAPLAIAATIGFVLLFNHNVIEQAGAISVRSFFGVAKITESTDGQFRLLQHGTTLHGGQRIRDPRRTAGGAAAGAPDVLLGRLRPSARHSTRCERAWAGRSASR